MGVVVDGVVCVVMDGEEDVHDEFALEDAMLNSGNDDMMSMV